MALRYKCLELDFSENAETQDYEDMVLACEEIGSEVRALLSPGETDERKGRAFLFLRRMMFGSFDRFDQIIETVVY